MKDQLNDILINKTSNTAPLIITLKIDEEAQQFFDEQRQLYFPAHVNYLKSHLTLFHKLPSNDESVDNALLKFSEIRQFTMNVSAVKNIGNGTVYAIESDELQSIHKRMQQEFHLFLISQDRNKIWPHITVQNKVTAYKAKLTTEKLSAGFSPFDIKAIGFSAWLYLNGPWEKKRDYYFENIPQINAD